MKTTQLALLTAALFSITLNACATPQSAPVSVQAAKTKAYPLKTCIVTDNDLDSMGGEIVKNYNGQEIKFCCKPCVKKFEANQAKYLKKIS